MIARIFTPAANVLRLMDPPREGLRKTELLASAAQRAQKEECWKNFLLRHVVTTIQLSSALFSEFCLSGLGVFEEGAAAVVDVLEGRLCRSIGRIGTVALLVAHMVMLAVYGTPLAALCFFAPDRMIAPFSPPPAAPKISTPCKASVSPTPSSPPTTASRESNDLQDEMRTLQEAISRLRESVDQRSSETARVSALCSKLDREVGQINERVRALESSRKKPLCPDELGRRVREIAVRVGALESSRDRLLWSDSERVLEVNSISFVGDGGASL